MVHSCCIKKCRSEWKITENVTFHKFPTEPKSCERFLAAIPPNLQPKTTKHSVVCSKHFTPDSFVPTTNIRRRLKPDVVPTLFDNVNCLSTNTQTNKLVQNKVLICGTNVDLFQGFINDHLSYAAAVPESVVLPVVSISDDNVELRQKESLNDELQTKQEIAVNESPTSSTNAEFCQGKDLSQAIMIQNKPNTSLTKEVSVQTADKFMAPSDEVVQLRNKIKVLQNRLRRREMRLGNMQNLVQRLSKKEKTPDPFEKMLSSRFSGFALDLIKNELQNSSVAVQAKRYSEEMRDFATTLYIYSPRAYDYVGTKLSLPHKSMLSRWLSTNYNCESDSGETEPVKE